MINYLCLKASEFEDLLMLFADDVAGKVYNKMPYDKWKDYMKRLDSKDYPFVDIDFGETEVLINFIDHVGNPRNTQIFHKGDKSFGDFLFREYGHLLNDFDMTTSTSTSINMAASTALSASADGLTGTVSNSWMHADKVAGVYDNYSTSIADAISYSYDGTSAKTSIRDDYVVKADWHNHPSHNLTIDKDGNLMYDGKRIVCADDNNEKENNKMKNFNFDFGPCNPETIRMSMYGLAIKNSTGTWVSYNPATKQIIDVDVLNFDGAKFLYKMPVALKEVKAGDIVVHNRKPMFVTAPSTDGSNALQVVDIYAGEEKCIVPAVSPFGFNFVTKVVSLFGNMMTTSQATAENPFGNAFMMYALMSDENTDNMLPLMLMAQNGNNINPFMMMMLCDDKGSSNKNLMAMMAMSGMFNNTPAPIPAQGNSN